MERRFWIWWMIAKFTIVWIPMKSSAETCPSAIMEASPGTVTHHGHTVNLTCTLTGNTNPCNPGSKEHMKIYTHKTLVLGRLRMDSVTVQDLRPPPGETIYQCWKCKMLCVISVFAGFPPDRPRSITCEQEGELGKLFCSWETGRETFIETTCTLQILQETHNVTVSSKCNLKANPSIVLPVTIAVGGKYTVLVQANNDLGENVSLPYTFTYIDAVKPYPPDNVTVTCTTSQNCTATIHTEQHIQHFRLRYRIVNDSVWEQLEILSNTSLTLHTLRPLTQYEFQAACKYVIGRGKWSRWSDVVTHETPEDAPHGKIEVWYRLHQLNSTFTIYWKYLNFSELRGRIQFYQVIFEDSERHALYIQNTTNTWLSRIIDTEGCVIKVSAHNSMGSSPPASTRISTHSLAGLPSPRNVIAITSGPKNLALRWELPAGIESAGDQIVAWEDPTGEDQSHTNWIIVPKRNRSVTISGSLKPNLCYQFYVYLLWGGRAGLPGITQSSTQQTAPPLTGPKFKYEVHKENSLLVTWQDVPAEAQMGCILHYNIYLRAPPQTTRVIKISSNQSTFYHYEIDNIEKNVQYSLEMTCSNEAGESPPSPLTSAYVQPQGSEEPTMVIVFVVILLCTGFLFSISFAKQRMQVFLSRILPHWWSKPVPDPANCEWAKEYMSSKEKRKILPNVASSVSDYDDETETLEIEEIMSEDDESPASVFSYKIDITTIQITQEDTKETSEGILPALTMKLAQSGEYKSLENDHPPLDYLVHNDVKSSDYLVHNDTQPTNYLVPHDEKPTNYLIHHDVRLSNYLVQDAMKLSNYQVHHDEKPTNYLVHDKKPTNYLSHHDVRLSNYLVQDAMKLPNYQVHHDEKPTNYLVHDEKPTNYLVHDEKPTNYLFYDVMKSSNYQVYHDVKPTNYQVYDVMKSSNYLVQDMKPLDYLVHHELTPSDHLSHHNNPSENLAHIKSDYLAHYETKLSDSLVHRDVKLLNPIIHHLKPSDHLGHNEIKVDYLPTNMSAIMEDLEKEQKDFLVHHLFPLSSGRTNNTISLDTVQINFPYTVQ